MYSTENDDNKLYRPYKKRCIFVECSKTDTPERFENKYRSSLIAACIKNAEPNRISEIRHSAYMTVFGFFRISTMLAIVR